MIERRASEAPMNKTAMELPSDREIVISRTFQASARIVFNAWTQAELVKRWWAPKCLGVEMVDCQADVRVGGKYRYLLRTDGNLVGFGGKYSEVAPYTRLVYTEFFEPSAGAEAKEPEPGAESIITVTFEEQGGKTRLISRSLYPSKEVRDAVLSTGMEQGMRETMDQLDTLVASLC